MSAKKSGKRSILQQINEIIFGSDTPEGRLFDIILFALILLSVLTVLIDSVGSINRNYGKLLITAEWGFTIIFSIEYILRVLSSPKPKGYIFSFYGLIDLLSILPTYLSLILVGSQYFLVIRILRLLRVFRVLKLGRYVRASRTLSIALFESKHKIIVFLEVILTLVIVMGSLMYLIEGPEGGFSSIPRSIYWAIVTLTTVGYGDIAPQTVTGQFLASIIMITGYAIIAVPTGIISVELSRAKEKMENICPACHKTYYDTEAKFCSKCGEKL
ncbi:MAG: ion transporter [Bacteroidales bacterium]|nr:ion transporter [Bacteroidales bacterium]